MPRLLLLLAIAVICACAIAEFALADSARALLKEGKNLTAKEVATPEEQLEEDPLNMSARTRLLGYYADLSRYREPSSRARSRALVLWLIQDEPESSVLAALPTPVRELDPFDDPEGYVEGKRAFLAHLDKDPNNLTLLDYTAGFLSRTDRSLAINLLQRAQFLDPSNAILARRLAFNHYSNIRARSKSTDIQSARKSVEQYEHMLELTDGNPYGVSLQYAAKAALIAANYEKARYFVEVMLRSDASKWNHTSNIHHGNITLSRIALAEGDIKKAGSYLLQAGSTPGSPLLKQLGPDTVLAKELLEQGAKKTVLRYFDQCAKFWERGRDRLREWRILVRAGRIPNSWYFGR